MTWHEEAPTTPPEPLIAFVAKLQDRGTVISDTEPVDSDKRGRTFIAETPVGHISIIALKLSWQLRLLPHGAKNFVDAADWKAVLEGKRHNWRTPSITESIEWLDEILFSGAPTEINTAELDKLTEFKILHAKKVAWAITSGIAIALLGLSLGLFWLADVTHNTIAAMNAIACLIIFVIYLFQWARFMWGLRE